QGLDRTPPCPEIFGMPLRRLLGRPDLLCEGQARHLCHDGPYQAPLSRLQDLRAAPLRRRARTLSSHRSPAKGSRFPGRIGCGCPPLVGRYSLTPCPPRKGFAMSAAQAQPTQKLSSPWQATNLPKIAYGKGSYLYDTTGKQYIDGSGGPAVY